MATDNDDKELEGGTDDAAERHINSVKEKVREAKEREREPEPDEDEEAEVVEVEEEDETDTPTRREKRSNRYREEREAREAAERRAEVLAAQQNELMQRLIELQRPKEPEVDHQADLSKEYRATERELIRLRSEYSQRAAQYEQAGQRMPDAEIDEFIGRQEKLELRKHAIIGDNYVRERGLQAPDPRKLQQQMEISVLRAQNTDVFNNADAAEYVNYAYRRLLRSGQPDNIATVQAAVVEARKTILKKADSPKPTQNQKAKYAGGGVGGGSASETPVFRITEAGKRMADSAYSHIKDDNKRYQMWAKSQLEAQRKAKQNKSA